MNDAALTALLSCCIAEYRPMVFLLFISHELSLAWLLCPVSSCVAAPLYCWMVDVWAKEHPSEMAELRAFAGGAGSKPVRKPQSVSPSSPSPAQEEDEAVRPFVGVIRAFHELLYLLSVSCWVANHSEWRRLNMASSFVLDPLILHRLRSYPFVSLVVLCKSPLFDVPPMSLYTDSVTASEVCRGSLARQLVEHSGVLHPADGASSVTSDVHLLQQLMGFMSHCWLSAFRMPHLEMVALSFAQQPMDDQQLQQIEPYVRTVVARLPTLRGLGGLETALTALAALLGPTDPRSVTENVSPLSLQTSSIRVQHAMESMQKYLKSSLRTCVWHRFRSEAHSLCHRTWPQLQHSGRMSKSIEELIDVFDDAWATLQSETAAVKSEAVVAAWLLQDETQWAAALSQLLAELRDCTVAELGMKDRSRVRGWRTLIKLASLYLAAVQPYPAIGRTSREHNHRLTADAGGSEQCLLCIERQLSERVDELMPWLNSPRVAWMDDAAQQVDMVPRLFHTLYHDTHLETSLFNAGTVIASVPVDIYLHSKALSTPFRTAERISASYMVTAHAMQAASGVPPSTLSSSPAVCTVCNTEVCDALLLPCYHVTCCQSCGLWLMKEHKPCPRCFTVIQRIIPVRIEKEVEEASLKYSTTPAGDVIVSRPTGSGSLLQQFVSSHSVKEWLVTSTQCSPFASDGSDGQEVVLTNANKPDTAPVARSALDSVPLTPPTTETIGAATLPPVTECHGQVLSRTRPATQPVERETRKDADQTHSQPASASSSPLPTVDVRMPRSEVKQSASVPPSTVVASISRDEMRCQGQVNRAPVVAALAVSSAAATTASATTGAHSSEQTRKRGREFIEAEIGSQIEIVEALGSDAQHEDEKKETMESENGDRVMQPTWAVSLLHDARPRHLRTADKWPWSQAVVAQPPQHTEPYSVPGGFTLSPFPPPLQSSCPTVYHYSPPPVYNAPPLTSSEPHRSHVSSYSTSEDDTGNVRLENQSSLRPPLLDNDDETSEEWAKRVLT